MNLLAGVHDPQGKMLSLLVFFEKSLKNFQQATIAYTENTNLFLINRLRRLGLQLIPGNKNASITRRDLLMGAKDYFLMSDVDKLIHQQKFFPEELKKICHLKPKGYLILGRTKKGRVSCPESWSKTEKEVNALAAKKLGIPNIDICAGPFVSTTKVAKILVHQASFLSSWGCLPEYPLIIKKNNIPLEYKEFAGLEWEDPDRYQEEITNEGFENWKKRLYDSDLEWQKRKEFSSVMMHVLNCF